MPSKNRSQFVQALIYLWVFPNSFLGLFVGLLGLATGGKWQWRRGCVEFYGGFVTWLLVRLRVMAMTLGHTIIGQEEKELEIVRDHEQVHVRQYERWGHFSFRSIPGTRFACGFKNGTVTERTRLRSKPTIWLIQARRDGEKTNFWFEYWTRFVGRNESSDRETIVS